MYYLSLQRKKMKLNQFINWLFKSWEKLSDDRGSSPFTDLSPVDNADPDGSYTKALTFAFKNPRIKNIALTGPYGSGKSSIIKTFEKNNNYKFLNISLASFKEDNSVNTVLIERSILQQMLYGADANTLPFSRFKRITTPTQPLLKALLLVIWAVVVFFLYRYQNEILVLEYFHIPFVAFALTIPVVIVSDIYKASFGISLKKVSLMNAEIEAGEPSENSILNRHLDEIIYFFQVTHYNVVVLEDLDRFGEPEIFVKLREINKLINDNHFNKNRHPIKFLYAVKDDMFVHKNRAKFFDFIIPVVPIINSSNSLDKMQERLSELDFAKAINTQFLREVSLYIDDLRLIHNIFNEFVIYYEHIKSKSLDVTKLLAMIIYKNVYPNDFENLHYGKGALFRICEKRFELLQESKNQLKDQMDKFRAQIKLADTENARSIQELISTYFGHIVMNYAGNNNSVFGIVIGGNQYAFSMIKTFEQFEPIISEKNIQLVIHNQNNYRHLVSTNKSFSGIEEEINPGETFLRRVEHIKNKSIQEKNELQKEMLRVEKEIADVPHKRFFEILQSGGIRLEKLIEDCGITDSKLLAYLVRNGHLDDNYHLYISTFHEGRLTKIDRDFILTIRNFNPANPNQKIDTPREVCANMRESDFEREYVLNVTLIDHLLENEATSAKRIKSAMRYISKNFNQSDVFFTAYFNTGKYLDKLIRSLSLEWPDYAGTSAWFPGNGTEHLSYIFRFVEAEYISEKMNKARVLTKYLSEYGALVLASDLQLPDSYDFLIKLHVRFDDLTSLEANDALIKFSYEECIYTINHQNINYILERFADTRSAVTLKPEKANYTSILAAGSKTLKDYVERNLPDYIEKVVLALPDNSEESEEAILAIINHESIDDGLKKKIISKQNYVFETFERIPQSFWSHLLLEEKIAISWQNISKYFSYEDSDKAVLTSLLGRQNIVSSLSSLKISRPDLGEEDSKSLSSFVLNNNEIKDSDYSKLIKCLPYRYLTFPTDISKEKIEILANEGTVKLTEKTFNYAANDHQLTAILISKNIDVFTQEKEKYPISDDVRELLLASEISHKNKITVSLDVTPLGAAKSKQLSRLIAGLLVSDEADCSEFDDTVLSSAIVNARTSADSIRVLMKCLSTWDEIKAMAVLAELPEPYSEISAYGKRPRLDNNEINLSFARLLETKGFISSVKVEDDLIKINTFKSSDHSG